MRLVISLVAAVSAAGCFFGDSQPPDDPGGGGSGGGGGGGGGGGNGPCGEPRCSPKTPNGIDFPGAVPVSNSFPNGFLNDVNNHIAIGGTHEVHLQIGENPFAFTYEALSDSTADLVVEGTDGPNVTLRGLGAFAHLRIVDPGTDELYDRAAYASSSLDRAVALGTEELMSGPGILEIASSFAFAPGTRHLGIAFLNAASPPNRLVDTSATLAVPGGTQTGWDLVDFEATVGTHELTANVGARTVTAVIEVTDTATTIEPLIAQDGVACFGAYTPAHAFISGLAWSFEIEGGAEPTETFLGPNCVFGPTQAFTVTATAGGKSLTITTEDLP